MNKKITYLFGAGASCGALPILKNMPDAMQKQIDFLNHKVGDFGNSKVELIETPQTTEEKLYISDLTWLLKHSSSHASVDTFAKKLYLTGKRTELFKLKNCLSAFLLIEQLRNPVDPRYDTFFASLLTSKFDLPKELSIISWNYDMQFEMAYQQYSGDDNIYSTQTTLGIYSKFSDNWRASERFGIYKLNGSSIAYHADHSDRTVIYSQLKDKFVTIDRLNEVFKSYSLLIESPTKYNLGLSFAWEEEYTNFGRKTILETTLERTKETEILVIIGYSIPFFNRQIDRAIIGNMEKLQKVYFQSKEADGLKERFSSLREGVNSENLISKFDCDQFYLPNEL